MNEDTQTPSDNQTPSDGCDPSHCSSCSASGCSSAQQTKPKPKPEHAGPRHAAPGQDDAKLKDRLGRIQKKIIVMSGKGGVGKSAVAVNIAMAAI